MLKTMLKILRQIVSFLLTVFVFCLFVSVLVLFMATIDYVFTVYIDPWMGVTPTETRHE